MPLVPFLFLISYASGPFSFSDKLCLFDKLCLWSFYFPVDCKLVYGVGKLSQNRKVFRASSGQLMFETAGRMVHFC